MAKPPPGTIRMSSVKFDRLYPKYEREKKPGQTFQQWLKSKRR